MGTGKQTWVEIIPPEKDGVRGLVQLSYVTDVCARIDGTTRINLVTGEDESYDDKRSIEDWHVMLANAPDVRLCIRPGDDEVSAGGGPIQPVAGPALGATRPVDGSHRGLVRGPGG